MPSRQLVGPEEDLCQYFTGPKYQGSGAAEGIDEQDAGFIDEILGKYQLSNSIAVDRARLRKSCEAWVWVSIVKNDDAKTEVTGGMSLGIFDGFEPCPLNGVITWSNSD